MNIGLLAKKIKLLYERVVYEKWEEEIGKIDVIHTEEIQDPDIESICEILATVPGEFRKKIVRQAGIPKQERRKILELVELPEDLRKSKIYNTNFTKRIPGEQPRRAYS